MVGNQIETYAVWMLVVIYLVHVILMKLNHMYEVGIKKSLANAMEVGELKRIATEDISHFHYNLDSRNVCLEMLNKIKFR